MINKKIVFISSDNGGCYQYRCKYIADYLQQESKVLFPFYKIDNNFTIRDEVILSADIIVLQRHTDPIFLHVIPDLKILGKKVVYDIDDNLWSIPSSNLASSVYNSAMLKTTNQIIKLCDHVTVSTEPLKNYISNSKIHDKVTVIPNMLPDVFPFEEKNNDKVRIGFCGTKTHSGDFNYHLCKALRNVKTKYGVELVFMGYDPLKDPSNIIPPFCKVEDYMDTIRSLNLDIAIAPLENNEFNRAKSNIKFLEYSSCGIATIASNVYPFTYSVDHCENGYLIYKDKEWEQALYTLIDQKEKRELFQKQANDFVSKNYTYKNNGQVITCRWSGIIKELYKE